MTLAIHPALAGFPEQPEHEIAKLALDVKKHGQVNPVVLCEKQVLDGRARLVACDRAGVEPTFHTYEGDDPVGFVVQANAGRQMTPGQRALAAARAARAWKERSVSAETGVSPETDARASDRAAQAFGVSRATVFRAERLLGDEELLRAVESGRMKVNEAFRRAAPASRKAKGSKPPVDPDDLVAVAAAVKRVEQKALALREELRDVCARPRARSMMGDFLRGLATDFFNFADEDKSEEEGAAAS